MAKLIVANPRNIQKGIHILRFERKVWYEGDEFVKPDKMKASTVKAWQVAGFLKEVGNG